MNVRDKRNQWLKLFKNIRLLRQNFDQLFVYSEDLEQKPRVTVLTENWAIDDIETGTYTLSTQNQIKTCNRDGIGGSVRVFVSDKLRRVKTILISIRNVHILSVLIADIQQAFLSQVFTNNNNIDLF